MTLNICTECGKKIRVGEKMNLIYRDDIKKYWTHAGKCYSNYLKLLLDPKEAKRGAVIGFCGACEKPVREKDKFGVARIEFVLSKLILFRSFPKKSNIYFFHKKCVGKTG